MSERRRFYAEEIEAIAHLDAPALIDAYATVPREAFLGPGPWKIATLTDRGYRTTPDDDTRHIYHDVVVAIDPVRNLNNGQPSALAKWIAALGLGPGSRVMHVGTGTGYYTAIMATLVGASGRVVGFDVDPALAERARTNLAAYPQVVIEAGDASAPSETFDGIFINAGCTYAHPAWLAALAPTGRIVLPLTVHFEQFPSGGVGVMVCIERADWSLKYVTQVGIFYCAIARDPAHEAGLRKILSPTAKRPTRVEIAPHEASDECIVHVDGFCLR